MLFRTNRRRKNRKLHRRQMTKQGGSFSRLLRGGRFEKLESRIALSATEIIFVDHSVWHHDGLPEAMASTAGEVVVLNDDQDGIQQMADYLDGRNGISAIHLLSHGDVGEVSPVGSSILNAGNLGEYSAQLATIGQALTADGDILLWGCAVAGLDGTGFVQSLATATGADVAASDDLTGSPTLGGDWDLEYSTGPIEATNVIASLDPQITLSHFRGGSVTHSVNVNGLVQLQAYSAWRNTAVDTPSFQLYTGPSRTGSLIGSFSRTGDSVVQTGTELGGAQFTVKSTTFTGQLPGPGTYYANWTSCCRVAGIVNAPESTWELETKIVWAAGTSVASPTLLPATIDIIAKGHAYTQFLNSSDPDGTPLSFQFLVGATDPNYGPSAQIPGINLDSLGRVNLSAANTASLAPGRYVYKVRVTDGQGAYSDRDVLVVVQDPANALDPNPTAPILTPIGPKIIPVGTPFSFNVSGVDPDGKAVKVRSQLLPSGAAMPEAIGTGSASSTFNWTPVAGQEGTYFVNFETFETNESVPIIDNELVEIQVVGANDPPVLDPIGHQSVATGGTISFTLNGTDANGDNLTYSAFFLPAGANFNPATRVFSWTPSPAQYNNTFTDITFRVTDDGVPNLFDQEPIAITVGAGNAAPVFTSLPDLQVILGNTVNVNVVVNDTGAGQTITVDDVLTPLGSTFVSTPGNPPVSGVFNWTPTIAALGTHTVRLRAEDNGVPILSSLEEFTITVVAPPTANAGGVPVPYTVDEGTPILLDGSGSSDLDGGIVLYEWDLDYDGSFDVDLSTASPTVPHTFDDDFSGVIALRVKDVGGLTDIDTASLTVNNVVPELADETVTSAIIEGGVATLTGVIDDPGADTFNLVINWGDDSALQSVALGAAPISAGGISWDPATRVFGIQHTYLDDNPTGTTSDAYFIGVTVSDDDGGQSILAGGGPTSSFYATSEDGRYLVSIDENTGVATTIGSFGYSSSYTGAFTPDGRFWTIVNSAFAGQLAEVNLTTGQATPVGAPPITNDWIISLDANPAGQLFAGSHNGRYYSVNTTTGQFTQLFQVGIYTCDFAFDNSGNLWAVDGGFSLHQLNPSTGALLNSKQMTGLAAGTMSIQVDPSNAFYVATTSFPAQLYRLDPATGSTTLVGSNLGVNYIHGGDFLPDSTGGGSNLSVTVNNIAPAFDAGANAQLVPADAGAFSRTINFTDPGSLDIHTVTVDYGDSSGIQTFTITPTGSRSLDLNHAYTTEGAFTVAVIVADDDAGSFTDTFNVEVILNEPPRANAGGPYVVNEGAAVTLDGRGSTDPDSTNPPDNSSDIVLYQWDLDFDGVTFEIDATGQQPPVNFADNFLTRQIALRVTDSHGEVDIATTTLTVANVAPVVSAGTDQTLDEGAPFAGGGSFTDPGADTWTATVDYGDGSGVQPLTLNPDKTFALGHTYADNGSYTVTVAVTDDDGGSHNDTLLVTVNNVAPVVSAGADQAVDEGSAFAGGGSFTDPGADTWTATVDYGDGSGAQPLTLNPDKTFALGHTYADNGTYTVTVSVTDDDGGSHADTLTVTVANVAPVVSAGVDQSSDEGSTVNFAGGFTDAGSADTHTMLWDFGDGATASGTLSPSHAYADNGVYTVTLTVTDDDGGSTSDTLLVTVANVAPVVNAGDDQLADEGSSVSFSGGFTDAGSADTHTMLWDFGDGATASGTLSPSHAYADNGVYTVTLTVTDDDGGSTSDTLTMTVNNVAPTARSNAYATSQAVVVTGNVISDDTGNGVDDDPAGTNDPLVISSHTNPTNGSLVLSVDGSFVYTPDSTFAGVDSFTYEISDGDGGFDTATVTINVSAAAAGSVLTIADTCLGGNALLITGTSGNDSISVEPGASPDTLSVNVNGSITAVAKPSGRIIITGEAGDDTIHLAGAITNQAWLYGDGGNDRLNNGNGGGLLIGGDGNDELTGGGGRDIMIGGQGADKLIGNSNDDILVAGYTTRDSRTSLNHEAFWCDVVHEWNGSLSFAPRVSNLQGVLLPEVLDDAFADDIDFLNGASGDDWLIFSTGEDRVVGKIEAAN